MLYERSIKYFDYLENKERLRGAGFVKMEVREGRCSMLLQLSGLRERDCGEKQVFLTDGRKEQLLGGIQLEHSSGRLQLQGLSAENLGGTGIACQELVGIRVPLEGSCEVFCSWQKGGQAARKSSQIPPGSQSAGQPEPQSRPPEPLSQRQPESLSLGEALLKPEPFPQRQQESLSSGEALLKPESLSRPPEQVSEQNTAMQPFREIGKGAFAEEELREESFREEETDNFQRGMEEKGVRLSGKLKTSPGRENYSDQEKFQPRLEPLSRKKERRENRGGSRDIRSGSLMEHKWQQLSAIYPHIKPFKDERDYLSIGPEDFVIFPEKYYKMANNSFLLHGYYNYEHLILARVEKKGRGLYYIGVPGNFYDREKQVALMFGFESFECLEEPAGQGDFGYYMMRLEL